MASLYRRRLELDDQLTAWLRRKGPPYMAEEDYAQMPKTLTLRELHDDGRPIHAPSVARLLSQARRCQHSGAPGMQFEIFKNPAYSPFPEIEQSHSY